MTEPMDLAPLLAVLKDLVAWLQATEAPGVVIGGVAPLPSWADPG